MATLVLASASSGRLGLLRQVGLEPDIIAPADIDETPFPNEKPRDYVLRLAKEKARVIAQRHPDTYIIAADSTVSVGRQIIGKAEGKAEAKAIIQLFSGRRHNLYTGLCIIAPDGRQSSRVVKTIEKFCVLTEAEIDDYLDSTDEWQGKCGCFGLQGWGGGFIEWINGSFTSVIGLPLAETRAILKGLGYKK